MMWCDPTTGKITIRKEMGDAEALIRAHRETEALGVPFVIHLRMRTHGDTNLDNVHPYIINDDMAYMHNGILASGYGKSGDKTRSDTSHFISDTLHPLLEVITPKQLLTPPMVELMGTLISNNRFIFLSSGGEPVTVNEQQFHDWYGIKMSNTYAWSSNLKISPTAAPAPVEHKTWGGWKGKSHGIYDMYDDAYWEDSNYSGPIASIATKRLSPKGDIIDADYIKDAIDLQVEAEERALREAEDAAEPRMSWVDFIDIIEEKYDFPTAQAVEFMSTYIKEKYTAQEIAAAEVDWQALAKWLFESAACALADLLADMAEGYELEILLNAKIAHPALSLLR